MLVKRLIVEDDGAPATEYVLIAALVAMAIILGATAFGTTLGRLFGDLGVRIGRELVGP